MTESIENIQGHWHKLGYKTRCDRCWKVTDYVFVVNSGPTTGKFCSKDHFLAAYTHMHSPKDEEPEFKG